MNTITVEQAIDLVGGKSNLYMSYNFPLARMIAIAKDGDGLIDEESFLRNIESCQGQAALNKAKNTLKNAAMISDEARKSQIRANIKSDRDGDSGHHHFMT